MIRAFLKATVFRKTIFLDAWIMLLSSFTLSFVMVFSFSMATSLLNANRLFLSPDMTIEGDLDESGAKWLQDFANGGNVRMADLVGSLYGVLESKTEFGFVSLKEVQSSYFNPERLAFLGLEIEEVTKGGILISSAVARRLSVGIGDRIAFVDCASGRAIVETVAGLFDSGLAAFDEAVALLISDVSGGPEGARKMIFDGNRSYELLFPAGISVRLFGKSSYSGHDRDAVRMVYLGPLADKASVPGVSWQQVSSSLDSIRFILHLFIALTVCYVFAFVKNFERRNARTIEIFKFLGCSRMRLAKVVSLFLITIITMLSGLVLGVLFCTLFKRALALVNGLGNFSLDYYLLKFKTEIPFGDFATYMAITFFALAAVCLITDVRSRFRLHRIMVRNERLKFMEAEGE